MSEIQLSLSSIPSPVPGLVSRVVRNEAILVMPEQGKVKVLNEVGARIWELSDGTRTIQQIAIQICSEYQVEALEAETDILDFVSDMVARGLLSTSDQPSAADE